MALAAAASQLSTAQGAAAVQLSTAQVGAAAANALSAFQGGTERARGALQKLAGEAQLRTGLLGEQESTPTAPVVKDGTQCEGCGAKFNIIRRRSMCGACDRYLCAACIGGSPFAALTGINCLCASQCSRCTAQGAQFGEFEPCREPMQTGVSVTIGLPPSPQQRSGLGGLFSGGAAGLGDLRRVHAWLSLGTGTGEDGSTLTWASLQQRAGRPTEEGRILFADLIASRNTGAAIELSIRGQAEATSLEFATSPERDAWTRYIELGMEVLTPESAQAALQEARASHRQSEMETRRTRNEERKKKLQENMQGMRFTAEAMVSRSSDTSRR